MGYFLYAHWLAPQLRGPDRIGQVLSSLQEEKLALEKQSFSVSSAQIIEEADNRIVIRFSYRGNDLEWLLNACGDITENRMSGPWGCEPRALQSAGSGMVDIGFVIANSDTQKSRSRECSDMVDISVYGVDGVVFYRNRFALEKVWHRDPGGWSWYRYRHEGCPVRH